MLIFESIFHGTAAGAGLTHSLHTEDANPLKTQRNCLIERHAIKEVKQIETGKMHHPKQPSTRRKGTIGVQAQHEGGAHSTVSKLQWCWFILLKFD
jgi:hypothetical protein